MNRATTWCCRVWCRTAKRTDASQKGKGVRTATNITGLFEWTGSVCYLQSDVDLYCNGACTTQSLCCVDTSDPADGIFESCELLQEIGVSDIDGNLVCPDTVDVDGVLYPYIAVDAQCRTYEDEWVFNIADFVGVMWDIDTTGAYVVQIRFYPL